MRRWIDIFRPLVTILLILQVSTAYALPAGLHLNLCFGSDGHFDISPDLCDENPPTSQLPQSGTVILSETPHGDCLDIEIGCASLAEPAPPITERCQAKVKIKKSTTPATANTTLSLPRQIAQSSPRKYSALPGGTLPPSHLISLRSILLLI